MNYFLNNGKLILGINYWASENAINMWSDWNADVVDKDFKKIKDVGLDYIRVFPLWSVFQPLCSINHNSDVIEYRFGEEPLPDTESGRAGVSEEACEKFEIMCQLAQKHGLKVIVGLITGHMSGRYYAPPAFSSKNPLTDYTTIKWEIRFIKYFVSRFKNQPCIAGWDLGNEVNGFADESCRDSSYVWSELMTNSIKSCDDTHPVISGMDMVPVAKGEFNIYELGEIIDMHTVHPYNIFQTPNDSLISMRPIFESAHKCKLYSDVGNVPTFIQEVGSLGYTNCSEKTEAEFYRGLLFSCLAHNALGVMWWCAFDQGHLEYMPYDGNNIGSNYGFFRSDGTEKPIAEVNRKFAKLMKAMPFECLPKSKTEAICLISRGTAAEKFDMLRTTHCLAEQADINLGFAYVEDAIPDAPLYILPSVDENNSISLHKLKEVLKKVENGASLYISLGRGLFRNVPEYSGMSLAYKEGMDSPEKINIDGNVLEVLSDFKYEVERCNAEIIATGEDERAVFVKNKYGNGNIYFSTISIEKYLISRTDVFSDSEAPDYSVWYKKLRQEITDNRIVKADVPIVCVTEHEIDDNNRYAILINYSKKPVSTHLNIKENWNIDSICYGDVKDNLTTIDCCDAVILRLKYNN